jgi:arylsulfatase A-like enzyme
MLGFPVPPEHVLDGESLLPLLRGASAPALQERRLFWHYPLAAPHFLGGESSAASRAGLWKLIAFFQRRELELYNLAADESERVNVATANPEQVEKQRALLEAWLTEVGGAIPAGQAVPAPPLVDVKQSGATP